MKKIISIVAFATMLAACNNGSTNTPAVVDSSMSMSSSGMDSMSTSMSPLNEGTVGMRQGRMMIVSDGGWKIMSEPATCSDGCKVMPNGDVIMKNGDKMTLKDGETIDKDGHIMDGSGKMMMDEKMDSMNQ
jgi:hypothetical protein